jgi:hypothetical protein
MIGIGIELKGLELRGAYGRSTNMNDWKNGKDFKIVGGPYCSNRDIRAIKQEGFGLLEFTNPDGSLVERIILADRILELFDPGITGKFKRV